MICPTIINELTDFKKEFELGIPKTNPIQEIASSILCKAMEMIAYFKLLLNEKISSRETLKFDEARIQIVRIGAALIGANSDYAPRPAETLKKYIPADEDNNDLFDDVFGIGQLQGKSNEIARKTSGHSITKTNLPRQISEDSIQPPIVSPQISNSIVCNIPQETSPLTGPSINAINYANLTNPMLYYPVNPILSANTPILSTNSSISNVNLSNSIAQSSM